MIRVLLADDEELVRAGLRLVLEADGEISVIAEATDGEQAVALAQQHRPDVVVIDIRMPGVDGLEATRRLTDLPTPPKVLVLTTFDLDRYVYTALEAGAAGFMLKDAPPEELARAVHVVHCGNAILAPTVTRRLVRRFSDENATRVARAHWLVTVLTPREREVLAELAAGLSNAQIGARLAMTEATVKGHVSSVLAKLGTANRVQAALIAYDAQLIPGR
jgi:DNA-binding NarL/FixJ family response regulator